MAKSNSIARPILILVVGALWVIFVPVAMGLGFLGLMSGLASEQVKDVSGVDASRRAAFELADQKIAYKLAPTAARVHGTSGGMQGHGPGWCVATITDAEVEEVCKGFNFALELGKARIAGPQPYQNSPAWWQPASHQDLMSISIADGRIWFAVSPSAKRIYIYRSRW